MSKNTNIEVEGSELLIKNKHGDYAVIPKKHRNKVKSFIKNGFHNLVDRYVSKLPKKSDYAQEGTVVPTETTGKPERDNVDALYEKASEYFNLGTSDEFRQKMSTPKNRAAFYKEASGKINLGTVRKIFPESD